MFQKVLTQHKEKEKKKVYASDEKENKNISCRIKRKRIGGNRNFVRERG